MNEYNLNRWALSAARGDNRAGARLYEMILPEIRRIASRVHGGAQHREDLIAAGLEGVARALPGYRAGRGFLPYARAFARGAMLRFLRDNSRLIRVPAWNAGKGPEPLIVPLREAEEAGYTPAFGAIETLIDAADVAAALKPWGGRPVTLMRFRKKLFEKGLRE